MARGINFKALRPDLISLDVVPLYKLQKSIKNIYFIWLAAVFIQVI